MSFSRLVGIVSLLLSFACGQGTVAPAGALVVGPSATYKKVQDAVNALSTKTSSAQTIFIEPGTYNEQVYIAALAGPLTVYGYTTDTSTYKSNQVTITNDITYAESGDKDDLTATVRNWSPNTKFYNINIANTAGAAGAQALALSAYAGNQGYYGVSLSGFQDTLLAETGNQVYAKSYISGAVDFIFGQTATAWFDQIDIRLYAKTGGTITANGRDSSSNPSYYVINNSSVAAVSGQNVAAGSFYLGRPWYDYSRVCFQECSLSSAINAAGWEEWSTSTPNTDHVTYQEYGNTGAGAAGSRASFSTKLSSPVSITTVLGSNYASWVDTKYL